MWNKIGVLLRRGFHLQHGIPDKYVRILCSVLFSFVSCYYCYSFCYLINEIMLMGPVQL